MALNFNEHILPAKKQNIFKEKGYLVWCGSAVQGDDGKYYLYYSRWKEEKGHLAWVTHSEVALAVSDAPDGPYTPVGLILAGSGEDTFDRDVIHNPTILKHQGKYYLYYMGTRGDYTKIGDKPTYGEGWWIFRNNQRVGVAVSDSPRGPFRRFSKPAVDVTPGSFDSLMTANPTVTIGEDGRAYMVYKAVEDNGCPPKGGAVICGVAIADDPAGPFIKQNMPIMQNPENNWSVEDPYIWYDTDRFYALVKDFQGYFTGTKKTSVALFESEDGLDWKPAEHPFAFGLEIKWDDGETEAVLALERPQLLRDQNGTPLVLCCAAARDRERMDSFNVPIPLKF